MMPAPDPLALLRLWQLTDSGFPTGGFAYSHGLEGLALAGVVRNADDIASVLRAQIEEGLAGVELPAMRHAHRAAEAADIDTLCELDRDLTALKIVPAFRAGSLTTGRRLLEGSLVVATGTIVSGYRDALAGGRAAGHQAVVFGVVTHAIGVDEETAALALGAGFAGALAAAAVRLGLIGQDAAQRTIAALHPAVLAAVTRSRQVPRDEMGAYLPMVDVAGLRHAGLSGRLFAS